LEDKHTNFIVQGSTFPLLAVARNSSGSNLF
jgi:hypothetical protein